MQIGGATGLIGDPTGRQAARDPAYLEKVYANSQSLSTQLQRFFKTATNYAAQKSIVFQQESEPTIVNNATWHGEMKMIDFLRDVGSFAKLQSMLARERWQTLTIFPGITLLTLLKCQEQNVFRDWASVQRVHVPAFASIRLLPVI